VLCHFKFFEQFLVQALMRVGAVFSSCFGIMIDPEKNRPIAEIDI
jgi:hypothetical protein